MKNTLTSLSSRRNLNKGNASNFKVVNAFKLKYPNASNVLWQQIEVSRWTVDFTLNNKWHSTLFDSEGNWLDTMTLASIESIPKNVKENFEKNFVKSGIKNIHQIEMTNTTLYEIKWTNGIFIWKFLYDISGKMVGKLVA